MSLAGLFGSGGASAPKTPGFVITPGKSPTTPMRVTGPEFGGTRFGGGVF